MVKIPEMDACKSLSNLYNGSEVRVFLNDGFNKTVEVLEDGLNGVQSGFSRTVDGFDEFTGGFVGGLNEVAIGIGRVNEKINKTNRTLQNLIGGGIPSLFEVFIFYLVSRIDPSGKFLNAREIASISISTIIVLIISLLTIVILKYIRPLFSLIFLLTGIPY